MKRLISRQRRERQRRGVCPPERPRLTPGDPLIDQVKLAICAGPRDIARVEHLVAGLKH
jgi:hypothetical protein